jgi:hypothetical protein
MTNPDPAFQRPALDVFAELRRGKAKHDMTKALNDVIAGVQNTGKKGELVIKLVVEPVKNDNTQVDVTDQIVTKVPTLSKAPSRFYMTDDHNLTRTDPQDVPFTGIAAVESPAEQKAN